MGTITCIERSKLRFREKDRNGMQRYRNLSGHSGVRAYECSPGFIKVRFTNGETYVYDDTTPGRRDVARMQALAIAGRGLSTYIAQHVRERYAGKEP
jgi:hypothetical protein